jgi:VWFA-related protein
VTVQGKLARSVVTLALTLLSLPAVSFGYQSQASSVVLKSETRAVQINVVAEDKAGDPIHGLSKENFTLFDNGKPREIQFFSVDADLPASSGVESAPEGSPSSAPCETAIILDCLNTEFQDQTSARIEAMKAVARIQVNESIAILTLGYELKFRSFTRDRGKLLAALHAFRPMPPPYPVERSVQVTLGALSALAHRMSGAPGRKSIVWITDGFFLEQSWEDAFTRAINKLNDANVALYTVDARGLSTAGSGYIRTLRFFADATGGFAFYNRNDVAVGIQAAIEDSESTYVIGFYLGDHERDRRVHNIKVEVDRPGATLRYRGVTLRSRLPDHRLDPRSADSATHRRAGGLGQRALDVLELDGAVVYLEPVA